LEGAFGKTELIAKPDNQVTLRSAPPFKFSLAPPPASAAAAALPPATPNLQNAQGQWKDANGKYLLTFSNQDLPTNVEGDRLSMKNEGLEWVFARED